MSRGWNVNGSSEALAAGSPAVLPRDPAEGPRRGNREVSPRHSLPWVLLRLLRQLDRGDWLRLAGTQVITLLPAVAEALLAGMVALLATALVSPGRLLESPQLTAICRCFGVEVPTRAGLCGWLLTALLVAMIIRNVIMLLQLNLSARLAEGIGRRLNLKILRGFLDLPWARYSTADLAEQQFSLRVSMRSGNLLLQLLQLGANGAILLLLFAGIVWVDWKAAALLLVCGLLGGGLVLLFRRRWLDRLAAQLYRGEMSSARLLYFMLHGLRELRLFGKSEVEFRHYARRRRKEARMRVRQTTLTQVPAALLETIAGCALLLVFGYVSCYTDFSSAEVASFMGLLAGAAWRMLPATHRVLGLLASMHQSLPWAADTLKRLESLPPPSPPVLVDFSRPFRRELRFDRVSYRYPGSSAGVSELDLTLPRGSFTGLVGASGAGKSTLVNLLVGLLEPEQGAILVDGEAMRREELPGWRRLIGYVPQNPFLFNATLRENITLSGRRAAVDRERLERCLRLARLDFVATLPQGVETVIGDRGIRLSGGEAQRVAIARALYVEPELLIFDEATGALDSGTEQAIRDTIRSLRGSVTILVITHRLSSVQDCDRVVWLEHGKIREFGDRFVLEHYARSGPRGSCRHRDGTADSAPPATPPAGI